LHQKGLGIIDFGSFLVFVKNDTAAEPPVSLGMRPEKKIFTLHSSLSALFSALYEDLTFFPRLALDVG
jgi:hypothetical protein